MKISSPLFDRIRVKPSDDRRVRADEPCCDWPGCREGASHRAPKGRLREGEYWRFCLEHVREYNQSYNFFAGMSEDAVARYQKESITGHRPTWKMGVNGSKGGAPDGFAANGSGASDPFGFFRELGMGPWRPDGEETARRTTARVVSAAAEATTTTAEATSKIR